jgi:RimJ/RimL family protein N-acetyltransferase
VGTGWWLLIHRDEGTVVGDAILQPVPRPTGEIEVGWHLAREHWGGGYATEAGGRLVRHGLETLGLGVIIADIAVQNERSIAVAGRIGMTRRPTAIVRLGFVHGVWEIKR